MVRLDYGKYRRTDTFPSFRLVPSWLRESQFYYVLMMHLMFTSRKTGSNRMFGEKYKYRAGYFPSMSTPLTGFMIGDRNG
jgi:hypothetical protein